MLRTRRSDWQIPLMILPALVVLSAITLHQDHGLWRQDAGWAWSLWASQTQIIGPIIGAVTAWLVGEQFRGARHLWLRTMRRRRAASLVAPLWCLLLGLLVLLGSAAAVFVLLQVPLDDRRWVWASAANAVGTVVSCVALGTLTGRFIQHRAIPGVVAIALWAMAIANPPFIADWLGLDGASMDLAGFRPEGGLALHRVIACLAVAAIAVYALSPTLRSGLFGVPVIAAAATIVTVVTMAIGGWFADIDDVQTDPHTTASACRTGEISVCVLPEHRRHLAALQTEFTRMASVEKAVGIATPTTFREMTPEQYYGRYDSGWSPSARASAFVLPMGDDQALGAVLSTLVSPECDTSVQSADAMNQLTRNQFVLTYWLESSITGHAPDHSPMTDAFDAMDPHQQAAWVKAALPSLQMCIAVPHDDRS